MASTLNDKEDKDGCNDKADDDGSNGNNNGKFHLGPVLTEKLRGGVGCGCRGMVGIVRNRQGGY